MFLTYGRDDRDNLIHIADARPGNDCGLFCPFCGQPLTAKQGDLVGWHFAHQQQTCRPEIYDDDDPIPSYDGYFIYGLTKSQRRVLVEILNRRQGQPGRRQYSQDYDYAPFSASAYHSTTIAALAAKNFLRTWLQPRAGWSLDHAAEIEQRAHLLTSGPANQIKQAILAREKERLAQTRLYFLAIETPGDISIPVFYKIGVTTRPLDHRISEIAAYLRSLSVPVRAIRPLFDLEQVSCVERYFIEQHRYWLLRNREYFHWPDPIRDGVLAELAELQRAVAAGLLPVHSPPAGRPRYRAIFARRDRLYNDFINTFEPAVLLVDIVDLSTGDRVSDWQLFLLGKWLADIPDLHPGDQVEFNATLAGGRLKRPARAARVG